MMSLEEQLANLRAGRAPSPPVSRVHLTTPSFIEIPQYEEVGEDDWEEDEPSPILQPSLEMIQAQPIHPPMPPLTRRSDSDQRQLYEKAIEITKSAMAKERNREFQPAVNEYVDAGDIFTEIGRSETDPNMRRTMKKKAFSLLQRAEALAEWLSLHENSESAQQLATTNEVQDSAVEATEKQIQEMKQELQQLKYTSKIMKAEESPDLAHATQPGPSEDESPLDNMKRAIVNEIHGLLQLPEINSFRKFQPLGSAAEKERYADDLKDQVEHLERELKFEKAYHLLANAMRKHKYSKMSSDANEQKRLQDEVSQLRQELQIHQTALEVTRQSIVEITEEKLRSEAKSAQHVRTLQKELTLLAKDDDSRWKRTRESRLQWFQGPRGLQREVEGSTRRRSDPAPESPRHVTTHGNSSDGEADSSSVWL